MANRVSDLLAGRFATPPALVNQALGHFKRYALVGTNGVLVADADGIILPVARLKSHWRILNIAYHNTAITGGTGYTLGLFPATDWSAGDGVALDADCYVASVTMAVAATAPVNATTGVARSTTANLWREVWQDAGVSAAPVPGTEYDLCWVGATVGAADGTIKTLVEYGADY